MATEQILMNVSPGETRIALVEKDRLSGLLVSRKGNESIVGNIYLGRVLKVLGGLQAAFVQCGLERAGFLSIADINQTESSEGEQKKRDKIANYVSEGDNVLVQVLRDPEEDKGAKLSTRITLTGRDLVFILGDSGVSLSRRIIDEDERGRLTDLIKKSVPNNVKGAFVVRAAAEEAETEDVQKEVQVLIARADEIQKKSQTAEAPACLYKELEPPFSVLREYGGADLQVVLVDERKLFKKLLSFVEDNMHDLVDVIMYHDTNEPLFETSGIEELIDAALDPVVKLPSGGSIIISETPALTAIDVNSGANTGGRREQNAFLTNKEAAEEAAKQIHLRNLSGLIVLDFISMRKRENQGKIIQLFRTFLHNDPMRPHVVGFTKLGLLEMTRRRQGASLSEIFSTRVLRPTKSSETIALEALRSVKREAFLTPGGDFSIHAAPDVTDVLETKFKDAQTELERQLGLKLKLEREPNKSLESFEIRPTVEVETGS